MNVVSFGLNSENLAFYRETKLLFDSLGIKPIVRFLTEKNQINWKYRSERNNHILEKRRNDTVSQTGLLCNLPSNHITFVAKQKVNLRTKMLFLIKYHQYMYNCTWFFYVQYIHIKWTTTLLCHILKFNPCNINTYLLIHNSMSGCSYAKKIMILVPFSRHQPIYKLSKLAFPIKH